MIGTMSVTICGESREIKADFKTGMAIADAVADPLSIMGDFAISQVDPDHEPEVKFNLVNSVKIIHCALNSAGHDFTLEQVGDDFVGSRAREAVESAMEFVLLFGADKEVIEGQGEVDRAPGEEPGKADGGSS